MHIRSSADAYEIPIVFCRNFHPFTYENYEYLFLGVLFMDFFHPLNRRMGTYKKNQCRMFFNGL